MTKGPNHRAHKYVLAEYETHGLRDRESQPRSCKAKSVDQAST